MIKTQTIAVCDLCGHAELARAVFNYRNEMEYALPADWQTSPYNRAVHICPECDKKLNPPRRGGARE